MPAGLAALQLADLAARRLLVQPFLYRATPAIMPGIRQCSDIQCKELFPGLWSRYRQMVCRQ